ncbi:MAG TPA: methyltransferase domain-containing protein [Allosphingosinicella sp.]|jgi:SAM-dependent methyltransferase|nr:methyltransferase domain-containing protein [Allosphingosinicella sp.]
MTVLSDERWIWDRYWHFDRIASCFDGAGEHNYDDSIARGWRAFFAALPPGARILDLCTGNGAVALLAAEAGGQVVAVDQAAIDPTAYVTRHRDALAKIDFRPGTAVEALPFPDSSFGAVVSQYGVEYSDLPRTIAELGRVVAPGGQSRLVVHAAEGGVAASAAQVIAEADLLLDTIDLPGAAQRCFAAVTRAERTPDASDEQRRAAREALAGFEAALQKTAQQLPGAVDKTMFRNPGAVLLDTFRRRGAFDLDQLLAKAADVRTEILAHRGRLAALVAAAVTRDGLAELERLLRGAGAQHVTTSDLTSGESLAGYVVESRF